MANFLMSPHVAGMLEDITAVIRHGGALPSENGALEPEHPMWVEFARSMAPMMQMPAELIAKMFAGSKPIKVLDISAGHGLYGIAFAKHNPNAKVVGLDWANVLEVAKENASKAGVADRYSTIAGSAFEVDFGSGYDIVLIPNFLHHFDPATNEKLLPQGACRAGARRGSPSRPSSFRTKIAFRRRATPCSACKCWARPPATRTLFRSSKRCSATRDSPAARCANWRRSRSAWWFLTNRLVNNLTNRLVFENLKHRPVRTLLGVIAISIQVTMVLTLVGLSEGMLNEQASRARGVGADILIRPPGGSIIVSGGQMDARFIPFIDKEPHVTAATGTLIFGTDLFNYLTGVDLATFDRLNGGFRFVQGGPFQHPDDVLIDEVYANQHKLHVGDTITNTNHKWRVSGIYEPGMLARMVVPLATLQDLTGNTGKVSTMYVKVDNAANIPGVIAELSDKLKTYKVYSMEDYTSLFSATNIPMLTDFIWVVVGVGVLVGFLVVFLSMYTAVLERTREIGVLKALGASPGIHTQHPVAGDSFARRRRFDSRHPAFLRHALHHPRSGATARSSKPSSLAGGCRPPPSPSSALCSAPCIRG